MVLRKSFRPSSQTIVAALMIAHASLLLVGIRQNFAVVDETSHVPAGISHWEIGDFSLYRVNPPLGRMLAALPVLLAMPYTTYVHLDHRPGARADWTVAGDFAELNAPRYFDLICLARLPGVLWSLLGAWVINRWCRELYGEWAGCLGVALWVFDPTVLAFAEVVTPDIPAAVAGLIATYVFWRYLRRGSWELALLSGVLLGIAQLTKFTMVILYGAWPLLALADRIGRGPRGQGVRQDRRRGSGRQVLQALAILLVSVDVINCGYAFDDTCWRLGDFEFVSRTLNGSSNTAFSASGNRFRGGPMAGLIVPLPAQYLLGIDVQKRDFEGDLPSYLAGEWRNGGWWYYYLYALAVKEPLGTLMLVVWGLVLTAKRHPGSARLKDELTVLLPAAVILILVSSQTGFNHHMRYILPAFPFVAVATGKLAYFLRPGYPRARVLFMVMLGWTVVTSLRVYPHSMSYFNEVAGGPENGHNHLVDSNIDWGQDLLALRDWYGKHPQARPLGLALFHVLDPQLFGIDYHLPPLGPTDRPDVIAGDADGLDRFGPHPGHYAVSVNFLRGLIFSVADGQGNWISIDRHDAFTYFRNFRPIARAGYSIYIYHITPDEADSVRSKMGLSPLRRHDAAPLNRVSGLDDGGGQ